MSNNAFFRMLTGVLVRTGIKPHLVAEGVLPKPLLHALYRLVAPDIRDRAAHLPFFQPWLADAAFQEIRRHIGEATLVGPERCWVLYSMARQALHVPGAFYECGVYRGGTAFLLRRVLGDRTDKPLRLFDTFAGMPRTDPDKDFVKAGDFAGVSLDAVRGFVGGDHACYYPGLIPDSFAGLPDEPIAFAHVDLDLWRATRDCCDYLYPRLSPGGVLVFDDYGYMTCPGVRDAVDEFFADKPEVPLVVGLGQAVVVKLPDNPRP